MDFALTDEQHQLVGSFSNLLSKASSPERVRAAEPSGHDEKLWRALSEIGAVTMAVPESRGGWGASMVDLALVAEQIGAALAPAPVVEAQVAARLLAAIGTDTASEILTSIMDGTVLVTLAVRPAPRNAALMIPAGAVSDHAVVLHDDRLLLVPTAGARRSPFANLAAAPLADVDMSENAPVLAVDDAAERYETAIDEWLTLTASAMVGIGTAALELGCAYAVERKAFGAAIGTFQGVAHPLADDATNLDGARLLTRKAAWALDQESPRGRELAAMAFAFASGAAEKATYDAIHVHGGYGFMLESDVQLHFRRVRGWSRVWGDAEAAYRRAAAARYGERP